MMRLVETPQVTVPVLPPVHPIDIEIVGDDEEGHLQPERPASNQPKARHASDCVETHDDEREDHNAEDVALRDGVEREVVEEPLAKERLTLVVRNEPLEHGQQNGASADRSERQTL